MLEILYIFSIFAVLFFCFSKVLLNNFKTSVSIDFAFNKITDNYKITNNLTVYDYETQTISYISFNCYNNRTDVFNKIPSCIRYILYNIQYNY